MLIKFLADLAKRVVTIFFKQAAILKSLRTVAPLNIVKLHQSFEL